MLKKMFYINVLSITILSLFNYIVFHEMNSKAYLENFAAYNQRITNLAFRNIDTQLVEAAMEIPQFYFSDSTKNQQILIPQEEKIIGSPVRIRGLVSQMEIIRKAYPYVESVDIFYETTGTVVTGFTSVHDAATDESVRYYLPWYEKFVEVGSDTLFLENAQGIYPTNDPVLTYVKKISRLKWKNRGIFIAVHISMSSFQEFIDEGRGSLVLTTPSGQVLYMSAESEREVGEQVLEQVMKKEDETQSRALLSAEIAGEDMTVFSFSSPKTGLKYVYYIPNNTFYEDYNVKKRIFFLNFVVSIVFNLVILALFSWINHNTFKKQVLKASKEAGIDIENGKSSIDDSLNILTREILILNETVQFQKSLLWQNAVRALILNREAEMGKEKLGTYLCFDSVRTVLLDCTESFDMEADVEKLQQRFLQRKDRYHVLFTTMEHGSVVSVLLFDKKEEADVSADFLEEIEAALKVRKMVWGALFPQEKDNIKNSYRSAIETAQYRFIYPKQRNLQYEQLGIEKRKENGSHLKLFELIKRAVNSENYPEFKYHVEALLISFREGNYTIDYCRSTLRDLVALLYQIMSQKQLDMWIIFGYDIREFYKQIETIDEFEQWILHLCQVLFQNIRQKKESVDMDMQTRLLYLLNENLENDISLDFLADQFAMRPDVLSRLFKQIMGKGYSEYIKEKKMDRALELLKEDYSVKEIAQRLGYNSPQYFIKIFKEIYGMTPYQYKKAHLQA